MNIESFLQSDYVLLVVAGLCISVAGYYLWTRYKTRPDTVVGRVLELEEEKYSTRMSRGAARKEFRASSARGELLGGLVREGESLNKLEDQKDAYELSRMRYQHEMELVDQSQRVTEKANSYGVDNPTYLDIRRKQEFDRSDLAKRQVEIDQDLNKGFVYAQREHRYVDMDQDSLFQLYEKRKGLQDGNDPARADKLKLLNERIETEEKIFRERQQRLLQDSTREDLRGGDEDTNE
jgi:hypothetical protein